MISKEQYLQAKKTIADYELQEYLSGNSGLLDSNKTLTNVGGLWWESKPAGHIGPDVIRKVKEEAAARGYVKGAKVNGETLTGTLVDMLTYDGRYIIHGRTESGGTVFIHDMRDNSWAELDPKSPLQEAMDRGYRKGAVIEDGNGCHYKLTSDPVEDRYGRLRCHAEECHLTLKSGVFTIANPGGVYNYKLVSKP